MRSLSLALCAVVCLLAAPATAETAAEAMTSFGLIGTWSPDCGGPIRVTYAARPDAAPTSTAVINGTEQARSEIREVNRLGDDRITWTGVYQKYLPLDVPKAAWMPEPGETWTTVLEKSNNKIRSLESQRADGQKVLVRDGYYYLPGDAMPGRPIIWRKTDNPTPFFGKCPAAAN